MGHAYFATLRFHQLLHNRQTNYRRRVRIETELVNIACRASIDAALELRQVDAEGAIDQRCGWRCRDDGNAGSAEVVEPTSDF